MEINDWNSDTLMINSTVEEYELFENPPIQSKTFMAVYYILIAIIFLIGLIGNAFVCWTIAKRRDMRSPINMILLSLAVGDILSIIVETFALHSLDSTDGFVMSSISCKCLWYLVTLLEASEAIQITIPLVISLFYQRIQKLGAGVIITATWITASLWAIPKLLEVELIVVQQSNVKEVSHCIINSETIFENAIILLPLNILLVCLIVQKIVLKRPLNTLFFYLALIYVVFSIYLPIVKILLFVMPTVSVEFYDTAYRVSFLTSTLTLAYKPILYILGNDEFRQEYKKASTKKRQVENYEL